VKKSGGTRTSVRSPPGLSSLPAPTCR
jgi:hypothetical protein